MTQEQLLDGLKEAIVRFKIDNIKALADDALRQGVSAYDGVMNGMSRGMEIVGQ